MPENQKKPDDDNNAINKFFDTIVNRFNKGDDSDSDSDSDRDRDSDRD